MSNPVHINTIVSPAGIVRENDKGRGVYARRDFAKGNLVERSPVILVRAADVRGKLIRYTFEWQPRNMHAIALGVGSLFNHAVDPNLDFRLVIDRREIEFTARRAIARGEELTIHYAGEPGVDTAVGFKVRS